MTPVVFFDTVIATVPNGQEHDMLLIMKKHVLVWSCGILFALGAAAQQADVKLTLAYNVYVVGEPVLVQFELVNATRDLIDVGGADSKDALLVEITKGGVLNEIVAHNKAPIGGAFKLNPGQSYQKQVELDKWFSLTQEGAYVVRLVVVHGGMRYESVKKSFDVVPGIPLKDAVQMFVKRDKLKRMFKVVFWHRNQVDRLFLRIEDEPEGRVWDSLDLGSLLRLTEPKIDISPEGEVTVVHRSTQDAYIRTVLWSLPDSLEVVERNNLLDPEISATQRVKSLYGDMAGSEDGKVKNPWWKFWGKGTSKE